MHVEVDDHVRELREVELDAVEHPTLVRVLPRRVISSRAAAGGDGHYRTRRRLDADEHETTTVVESSCWESVSLLLRAKPRPVFSLRL